MCLLSDPAGAALGDTFCYPVVPPTWGASSESGHKILMRMLD
jgi:hypothetical protein